MTIDNRLFYLYIFCCIVIIPTIVQCSIIAEPEEIEQILNDRLRYNKYLTPTQLANRPTHVRVGMYIEGMSSLHAQTMDFDTDIYLEQQWADLRLKHSSPHRVLIKDLSLLEKMWHPDLYFANANSAKTFDVTAPNFLLWIFPNGTVHYEMRISLTVLCNMDFAKYPMDTQHCDMRILSYAYTIEQLIIGWRKDSPIILNDQLKLPDMEIVDMRAVVCNGTYVYGEWSCLKAMFTMKRQQMHHILQNYVPTILIVIISWFSFWLDVDSVPGRVSLCITTLLTLATHATSARLSLPQVSYAKAIDVWLEACLGFVFGVLIEFTIVNYLSRQSKDDQEEDDAPSSQEVAVQLKSLTKDANSNNEWAWKSVSYYVPKKRTNRQLALGIDCCCRWLFPALFLFFNIVYWVYYLCFA